MISTAAYGSVVDSCLLSIQNETVALSFYESINSHQAHACHGKRLKNKQLKGVMSDVHSPEQRSYNMSRVKGKNTKPELSVRRFLFANGFRYRLHNKDIFGKPDIILRKYKTVIFVHGCFWHGHLGCKRASLPKTNTEWWQSKISQNSLRDERATARLENSVKLTTPFQFKLTTCSG